jgi:UDP-N-acetylmuramoylalanine--D-glutamate ligase
VLGLGSSGVAASLLAARMGSRVSATDLKARDAIPDAARLEEAGVVLDLGGHDPRPFVTSDLVVVSPGVPRCDHLAAAEAAGAEVIAEVELACRCARARVVGVTGSNGKSTVTSMIGAIMGQSDRPSWTGGNLGTPLSEAVGTEADVEGGVLVVELSSFQLERAVTLRCEVAVLLNITPDHLDRYDGFEHYARTKGRIFANQGEGDHAVVADGEAEALAQARLSRAAVHVIGGPSGEAFVEGGDVVIEGLAGRSARFDAAGLGLGDPLALGNGVVAVAASMLAGASPAAVQRGLPRFEPLPHRFELVAVKGGVRWIDDSKATNPASVVAALGSTEGPVILIAGGLDKKLDYARIGPAAGGKVRHALLIGASARVMSDALRPTLAVELVGDLEAAVRRAAELARPGDTVLLSPACASFDQFRSFEHRGETFKRLVRSLT